VNTLYCRVPSVDTGIGLMKKDLQQVKRLRDHMIGLRMELDLIVNDLSVKTTDLEFLETLEGDLVYNINVLRQEKIIAIASQYKKSLLELESVRKKHSILQKREKNIGEKIRYQEKSIRYSFGRL